MNHNTLNYNYLNIKKASSPKPNWTIIDSWSANLTTILFTASSSTNRWTQRRSSSVKWTVSIQNIIAMINAQILVSTLITLSSISKKTPTASPSVLSCHKLHIQLTYAWIWAPIKKFTATKPLMRSLRMMGCPSPCSRLRQGHSICQIFVLNKSCPKQTPPWISWASRSYKMLLLPHLLLICLSTRDFKEPPWQLQTRKKVLLKPHKLLSTDPPLKMPFHQIRFAGAEAGPLESHTKDIRLSSSDTGG